MEKKYTKEELKYLMRYHGLKEMPIYYKGECVGKVTSDLIYIRGQFRYLTKDEYAVDLATEQIDDVISFTKMVDKPFSAIIEFYFDYQKKDEEETYEGTMDEVFVKFYEYNRLLRYINGTYSKFKDKEVVKLYRLWLDIMNYWRSFHLNYGNGIVD